MIREYTPDDIIYIEEIGKLLDDNYKFKINQFTKCLVYTENNIVIGFATYFIMYENAEVSDIAVKKEYQGQNIGSTLLEEVIKKATDSHCGLITLEVRASNSAAIEFYHGKGFRESTIRKNYYSNGENALLMVKML